MGPSLSHPSTYSRNCWAASKENLTARVAVVDVTGKPVAGAAVQVALLERKTYSSRKRLVEPVEVIVDIAGCFGFVLIAERELSERVPRSR